MQKVCRAMGKLCVLEDANGEPVSGVFAEERPVLVDVKYELKPSPQQPLQVDIYGRDLFSMGQTRDRLILENGIVLTGRTYGGGIRSGRSEINRVRLVDIEEEKIELYPSEAVSQPTSMHSALLGVVSTHPLVHGVCANGVARPGFPFSYRTELPKKLNKTTWSYSTLRLQQDGIEITFVATSRYWRKLVNPTMLQHDSIIGLRRLDDGELEWDDFNRVVSLLSNFLGWINHCRAPVFHIKGYRRGKLVYKGYDLYPHPTVRRDAFSWLPTSGQKNRIGSQAEQLQRLLDGFANTWAKNEEDKGTFHIALQMLASHSKGSPRHAAAVGYLRDTFGACSILIGMLIGASGNRTRRDVVWYCLKEICVNDELPRDSRNAQDYVLRKHPELWRGKKRGDVLEDEKGTLSRAVANVENWLLHIDDPKNAAMLLGLPRWVQQYLVEVSIWLADLLILRVVGYEGWYFNRLARKTELVPWVK